MINKFEDRYRFLSNFYIEPDGTHVEGEYQASKTNEPAEFLKFMFPGEAKRAGQKLKLRPDWEIVKKRVMFNLVYRKFLDHPELAERLVATGDQELVEGNHWGDTYWGVCNGVGQNMLGWILMDIRSKLVEGYEESESFDPDAPSDTLDQQG